MTYKQVIKNMISKQVDDFLVNHGSFAVIYDTEIQTHTKNDTIDFEINTTTESGDCRILGYMESYGHIRIYLIYINGKPYFSEDFENITF